VSDLRDALEDLGFRSFVQTRHNEATELDGGLRVLISTVTSPADGEIGDSALSLDDGAVRILNQNDARPVESGPIEEFGPFAAHFLQYSGAIWYPMVYDMPDDRKRVLCSAKVESQFARAMRYVESIDARAVVPSAGPPAFLDDELWQLNMIRGDELSIFPDQRAFLARLAAAGHRGILAIPGTSIEIHPDAFDVVHPIADGDLQAIFDDKESYLRHYQEDWKQWLDDLKATWTPPTTDLAATLRDWWEPLLRMAPTLCSAVGANCLFRAGDLELLIDFPHAEVRRYAGEPYEFRFDVPRELVETVAAERAVDWSNSLFLSARFRAWRANDFNEYLYNFFKSLSIERMRRTEAEAERKLHPPTEVEPDIELGEYVLQRRCPHRNADLSVFGEIEAGRAGDEMVCTLHGWRFDCATGRCLTADDRPLRIRRRDAPS
jgi:UDP-MurNAc hydroxylase